MTFPRLAPIRRQRVKRIASAAALLAVTSPAALARAQCCAGFTQQCAGTKSVWCVQNGAPAGTLPQAFCPYGDDVVSELETLFGIRAPGTFQFDVEWPANGGAHTGTDCNTFGDGVTGDAFKNRSYGISGFYGYLLALHEAINDWTGMSTPGWPTDFWADHISAFPNEMDWRIMGTLGAQLNDANLIAASPAQKARFWPGGDSEDSRVQMFDSIFVLPKMGNGYEGFSRIFSYIQGDGLNLDNAANNGANPDQRRTEYAAAYLSLGAGQSVLSILQKPSSGYSTGKSWPVCKGAWDGVSNDPNPSYTCSEANIDAIATAHCALAANGKPAADLSAFRKGDYAMVEPGSCGAACPSECGCKSATNACVAPWLADAPPGDAGVATDASVAVADAGGGSSGTGGSSGSGGGSSGGVSDEDAGDRAADASVNGNGATGDPSSSGCSCKVPGGSGSAFPVPPLERALGGTVLAGLVFARRHSRR